MLRRRTGNETRLSIPATTVVLRGRYESQGRNHLPANRSIKFRFREQTAELAKDLLTPAPTVLGDGLLEIFVLFAGNEADPLQGSEMLLCFGQVIRDEVRLADILVRAAMPRIELQRALIMPKRKVSWPVWRYA